MHETEASTLITLQEKNILHNGNLALDDVIEIARIMRDRSCARELKVSFLLFQPPSSGIHCSSGPEALSYWLTACKQITEHGSQTRDQRPPSAAVG